MRSEQGMAKIKAYQRRYQKERREMLKAQGLCVTCGKPNDNGMARCDVCLYRTRVETATSGLEDVKKIERKVKSLDEIALEARAAGLSYGEYVARTEYKV